MKSGHTFEAKCRLSPEVDDMAVFPLRNLLVVALETKDLETVMVDGVICVNLNREDVGRLRDALDRWMAEYDRNNP